MRKRAVAARIAAGMATITLFGVGIYVYSQHYRVSEPAARSSGNVGVVISNHVRQYEQGSWCPGDSWDGTRVIEFEPHVAADPADPDRLVASWMASEGQTGARILATASRDGGRTWEPPQLMPIVQCAPGVDKLDLGRVASDPYVAFGADGRAYFSAISIDYSLVKVGLALIGLSDDTPFSFLGMSVVTSKDGGLLWNPRPAQAIPNVMTKWGPLTAIDNVSLAGDASVPGLAYLATTGYYDVGEPENPADRADVMKHMRGSAIVTITRDGGKTWSEIEDVAKVKKGERVSAPQILSTPDAVHLIYYVEGLNSARLEHVLSIDRGKSWSEPKIISSIVRKKNHHERGTISQIGEHEDVLTAEDIISIASDPTGRNIAIAFSDARVDGKVLGVYALLSSDGGAAWSKPIALTDGRGSYAYLPAIAINPARHVGVTYLDIDPDEAKAGKKPISVNFVELADGAIVRRQVIDRFDASVIGATGDYQGLAAAKDAFVAVYVRAICGDGDSGCKISARGGISDTVALRIPYAH